MRGCVVGAENPLEDPLGGENPRMTSQECLFCSIQEGGERIIAQNDLIFAIEDGFAVTPYHTLIIPKRHVEDYFGLTEEETLASKSLLEECKKSILEKDSSVTGFNIGMNCGHDAGQTIFHCHIHLIPRRKGDVENPRGGVRHTIPGKGFY